jgi:hypothetical protein
MSETKTPRTDALLIDRRTGRTIVVHGETFEALEALCRQLERALATAKAELAAEREPARAKDSDER